MREIEDVARRRDFQRLQAGPTRGGTGGGPRLHASRCSDETISRRLGAPWRTHGRLGRYTAEREIRGTSRSSCQRRLASTPSQMLLLIAYLHQVPATVVAVTDDEPRPPTPEDVAEPASLRPVRQENSEAVLSEWSEAEVCPPPIHNNFLLLFFTK